VKRQAIPTKKRYLGHQSRAGFSQVEVAMSALIAGIVLASALNMAGAAARSQVSNNDQLRARLIASGLLAEVLELPFEDPSGIVVFGPEAGETTSPATRSLFDDVDDYHNWSSSAKTKSGQTIPNTSGLTTSVQVALADPNQLGTGGGGSPSSEVKRVIVSVSRGGLVVCLLTAVVTK
jgi:hypothetical protein